MFLFLELTGKQQKRCFNHLLKGFCIVIPHFAGMAAVMDVALVTTQSFAGEEAIFKFLPLPRQ